MAYYLFKILITALFIVIISEISKKSSFIGAILASVPLVSVLAILWLYIDTKDITKVISLSKSVFWLVIPSLAMFIALPFMLKNGFNFYASLFVAIAVTVGAYWLMVFLLKFYGVQF